MGRGINVHTQWINGVAYGMQTGGIRKRHLCSTRRGGSCTWRGGRRGVSVMNGWMPCGVYVGVDGWWGLGVMGLEVALGGLLGMMVVWGWAS